ncbi:MAG: hypothetical protein GF408_01665 [Candidatus Omnitrophica bacterium]|nr:hypothetical protein [Candidatus Omnitrophota bacterium]
MRYKRIRAFIVVVLALSFVLGPGIGRSRAEIAPGIALDTLSPPMKSNDLFGTQYKDIALIKMALQANIMSLADKGRLSDIADAGITESTERTIFNPASIQFFFREAMELQNGFYAVKSKISSKGAEPRTYYAVFSLKKDGQGGYPIHVYTMSEYRGFRGIAGSFPSRKEEDTATIERYIKLNEKIIDKYISEHIVSGDFAEIEGRADSLDWNSLFPRRKIPANYWPRRYLDRIRAQLDPFLVHLGTGIDKAFEGKNIVFIRMNNDEYPLVRLSGRQIKVASHTSVNAVYIFLTEEEFSCLDSNAPKQSAETEKVGEILDALAFRFLHEVGVSYGLSYGVSGEEEEGVVSNDVFQGYCNYFINEPIDEIFARYPELRRCGYNTAHLDKIEGRDYLASPEDKGMTAKMINSFEGIWKAVEKDKDFPFSDTARETFGKILEMDRVRREQKISITPAEHYMIFYAQVFGARKYGGLITFMEELAEEAGKSGTRMRGFVRTVLEDRDYIELYLTAKLLEGRSLKAYRLLGEKFEHICAYQLYGRDRGLEKMKSLYGDEWDDTFAGLTSRVSDKIIGMILYDRGRGDFESALAALDSLLAFQQYEHELATGIDMGVLESWVARVKKRIAGRDGRITDPDMEELARLSELMGYSGGQFTLDRDVVDTAFERALLFLKKKLFDEERIAEEHAASGTPSHRDSLRILKEDLVKKRNEAKKAEKLAKKEEAEEMAGLSRLAGEAIPTHPDKRFTLIMTHEFYFGEELEAHRRTFGDRFNLESVSAKDEEMFVKKTMDLASGIEDRCVALVPATLSEEQLQTLSSHGIRFVRTDAMMLLQARTDRDESRLAFQMNTYAAMLLARKVDEKTPENDPIYRLLEFYINSIFSLDEGLDAGEYIRAIAGGKVSVLLRGILSYRPAVPYRVPEYNVISRTLISA